jgi:hypothetical protein
MTNAANNLARQLAETGSAQTDWLGGVRPDFVCFGPIADIGLKTFGVRFVPEADIREMAYAQKERRPSGLSPKSITAAAAHEAASIQNWLYCSITAPKSGKRTIKLRLSKSPTRQNATTATKSGLVIAMTNRAQTVSVH